VGFRSSLDSEEFYMENSIRFCLGGWRGGEGKERVLEGENIGES